MRIIKKKRRHPEDDIRDAFMDWVILKPIVKKHLIAIENGGKRLKSEAAKLKKLGLIAGTPDYFLMLPRGKYHGFWIEFKADNNDLTDDQEQFFETATKQCYKCAVVWDSTEAIELIEEYLCLN